MATATIKFQRGEFSVTAEVYRDNGKWCAAWAGMISTAHTASGALDGLRTLLYNEPAEAVAHDLEK